MRTRRAVAVIACALLAVPSACSSQSDVSSQGTSPATSSTPVTTTTESPEPSLDLSARPFITFAPVPPKPVGKEDLPLPDGSADYWELFEPGAPWEEAAAEIDAFKIHAWQVRHFFTDDELLTLVEGLRDRGIPLAMEVEPLELPDPDVCDHFESMEGPYDLEVAQWVKDAGGDVTMIALDNPFTFGHKFDGEGACRYPVEEVVRQVVAFVEDFREVHPDAVVGSIEGLLWPSVAEDMATWLDTYEELAGEPFAFLHLDTNWLLSDWPQLALATEAVADSRGVPFGLIYMDTLLETNDEWLAAAASRMTTFEEIFGGTPDHVVFQSWVDQPDRVLPEDDPNAFTSLILRYSGNRTELSFEVTDGVAAGVVTTTDGEPIAGGTVEITANPLAIVSKTFSVSGRAPSTASSAVAVMRLNIETADAGTGEFVVHDVAYTEDGSDANLIPNGDFGAGMESWGAYGEPYGDGGVIATEVGNGRSMRLDAEADEIVFVDGVPFEVTPGADFEFSATLSVPEGSFDLGSVAIVFLDETEIDRTTIDFAAGGRSSVGTVTTNRDGGFTAPLPLEANRYELEAVYPGDHRHWRSSASTLVEVTG